jgi:hypothetical protein
MKGERGLLIKTLFQTGAHVSEFVNLTAEDVFFEEQMILIAKAKGGKSRYVPILPELAQELRTHLGQRTVGYLFETNRATRYSPRRIQQIIEVPALFRIATREHLRHQTVVIGGLIARMGVLKCLPVIGKDLLKDTLVPGGCCKHPRPPSEGGWDYDGAVVVPRLLRAVHSSSALSTPPQQWR